MPRAGIEPARGYPRGILSPLRLPIPPPRQPYIPIVYPVLLGSGRDRYCRFYYHFYIFPYALLDELCEFRGFCRTNKIQNIGGIMRYQLMIFQLILLVFSTGCLSGLEKDQRILSSLKKIY